MTRTRLVIGLGVAALVVLSGGFLLGDDKKPDDPKVKGTLPPHFKALGLSEEQTQQVYKIQASYKAKIDDLEQKIKDLKAEEKAEREKVLTDAQKAKLKEILLGEDKLPKDKPADLKDKKPTDDKPKDK
jgi:hypothetical protein